MFTPLIQSKLVLSVIENLQAFQGYSPMNKHTASELLLFAEETATEFRGLKTKEAFAKIGERYEELISALQWFIENNAPDEALRLAVSLNLYWRATKRIDEGLSWFERVLQLESGTGAPRGRALFDAAQLAFWLGDDNRATRMQNQALELGRSIPDPTVAAQALTGLARIALRSGDTNKARELCLQAIQVTEGTIDKAGRSNANHVLGVLEQMAGNLQAARGYMSERIELARGLGEMGMLGMECGNLSMVERQLGNLDRAEELAREALQIYYGRDDDWAMPWGMNGMAAIHALRKKYDLAAVLVGATEALLEAANLAWPPDERIHYDNTVAALSEAMGSSVFEAARQIGRTKSKHEAVELALKA